MLQVLEELRGDVGELHAQQQISQPSERTPGAVPSRAGFLEQVARRVDQVAIMAYDTELPADWLVGRHFAWQAEHVTELVGDQVTVFIGAPSYAEGAALPVGREPAERNPRGAAGLGPPRPSAVPSGRAGDLCGLDNHTQGVSAVPGGLGPRGRRAPVGTAHDHRRPRQGCVADRAPSALTRAGCAALILRPLTSDIRLASASGVEVRASALRKARPNILVLVSGQASCGSAQGAGPSPRPVFAVSRSITSLQAPVSTAREY